MGERYLRQQDVIRLLQFERAKWEGCGDRLMPDFSESAVLAEITATGALSNCLAVVLGAPLGGYPVINSIDVDGGIPEAGKESKDADGMQKLIEAATPSNEQLMKLAMNQARKSAEAEPEAASDAAAGLEAVEAPTVRVGGRIYRKRHNYDRVMHGDKLQCTWTTSRGIQQILENVDQAYASENPAGTKSAKIGKRVIDVVGMRGRNGVISAVLLPGLSEKEFDALVEKVEFGFNLQPHESQSMLEYLGVNVKAPRVRCEHCWGDGKFPVKVGPVCGVCNGRGYKS